MDEKRMITGRLIYPLARSLGVWRSHWEEPGQINTYITFSSHLSSFQKGSSMCDMSGDTAQAPAAHRGGFVLQHRAITNGFSVL